MCRFVILAVAGLAAMVASPEVARTQVQLGTPQLQLPPGSVKPGLVTAPPALDRKLKILAKAGINVGPSAIHAPTTLSVRQPWIDGRTHLRFLKAGTYDTRENATAADFAELYWMADVSRRYLVDCEVSTAASGGAVIYFRIGDGGVSGGRHTAATDFVAPIEGGRASLVTPAGDPGRWAIVSAGSDRLIFKACEITPIG